MSSVLERFRDRGYDSGGELYLSVPDARELVAAAHDAGQVVLGLEAAQVEHGRIQPMLDQIADFSSLAAENWRSRVERSSRAALQFLEQLPSDPSVWVTVVLSSDSTDGS